MLSIPVDPDGFYSLVCSLCGLRFKLNGAEVQEAPETQLFCPYCGIPSPFEYFMPAEVVEAAMRKFENIKRDLFNQFAKELERKFRGSKAIRFKRGRPLPAVPDKVLVESEDLIPIELACCERQVKVIQTEEAAPGYCPYCGVNY